jgi:hypothetical protein
MVFPKWESWERIRAGNRSVPYACLVVSLGKASFPLSEFVPRPAHLEPIENTHSLSVICYWFLWRRREVLGPADQKLAYANKYTIVWSGCVARKIGKQMTDRFFSFFRKYLTLIFSSNICMSAQSVHIHCAMLNRMAAPSVLMRWKTCIYISFIKILIHSKCGNVIWLFFLFYAWEKSITFRFMFKR